MATKKEYSCAVCTLQGCVQGAGVGATAPVLVVVSEAPSTQKHSPVSAVLTALLREAGVVTSMIYTTYAVLCTASPARTPKAFEAACCRQRLLAELSQKQPQVILTLGKTALKSVTGTNKGLTDMRGAFHKFGDGNTLVIATHHPASILRTPRLRQEMLSDIKKAWGAATDTTTHERATVNYKIEYDVVRTKAELIQYLNNHERYNTVALDVETASTGDVLCLGLATMPGHATVILPPALTDHKRLIQEWLQDKHIVGQGIKFDFKALCKMGISDLRTSGDTLLQSYVLNPYAGRHGLKQLVREHLDFYEDYSADAAAYKRNMENLSEEKLVRYNAYDAALTLLLYHVLGAKLATADADLLTNLLYPASDMLGTMEFLGISVDINYLNELDAKLEVELVDLTAQMCASAGTEFNPNSQKQLLEIMYDRLKLPIPTRLSTDKAALQMLCAVDKHEFPSLLLAYRNRKKFHSTYVKGLLAAADTNSRVHTQFNLRTTLTGRLSSSNPVNLQNITRGVEARNIFTASPGHTLVECDLSQAEIRGWCWYARDEALKAALLSGIDVHTATAQMMFGLHTEEVTKELRDQAKRLSFATLYQMSPQTLAGELKVTVGTALDLQHKFFTAYKSGQAWIKTIQQQVLRDGLFITPFGRCLRFVVTPQTLNEATRQAVNYPIQSLCSDIMLAALVRLGNRIKAGDFGNTRLLITVHDSVLLETTEDAEQIARMVKAELEKDVLDGWLPFTADAAIGTRWGELTKLKSPPS